MGRNSISWSIFTDDMVMGCNNLYKSGKCTNELGIIINIRINNLTRGGMLIFLNQNPEDIA
jgi:hypothetical protein